MHVAFPSTHITDVCAKHMEAVSTAHYIGWWLYGKEILISILEWWFRWTCVVASPSHTPLLRYSSSNEGSGFLGDLYVARCIF